MHKLADDGHFSDSRIEETNMQLLKSHDIKILKKIKKQKNRHKLPGKMKNTSTCNYPELIVEESTSHKSNCDVNSHKFHKKKSQYKLIDDENVSECNIKETNFKELKSDANIEVLSLKKKKQKKFKLLDEMENMSNCDYPELTVDESTAHKSDCDVNSGKFHKKKRKYKLADDENVSECNVIETNFKELESDNVEVVMNLKKKKKKNNFLDKTENLCDVNYPELSLSVDKDSTAHRSDNDRNSPKKVKHKLAADGNLSECRILETNMQEFESNVNIEVLRSLKTQKNKSKILDKVENASDINYSKVAVADSTAHESDNSVISNKLHKKVKHKLTDDKNVSELDRDSDIEVLKVITKSNRKKKKKKLLVQTEGLSDCSYPELVVDNPIAHKLDNSLECNKVHEKKHKFAYDENLSESRISEISMHELENDINNKDLKYLKKQRNKHKSLGKKENVFHYHNQESGADGINDILDHVQKRNKVVEVEKILAKDSYTTQLSQDNLDAKTLNGLYKEKRKKHNSLIGIKNVADCSIQESSVNESEMDKHLDVLYIQKINKQKLLEEMKNISNCTIEESPKDTSPNNKNSDVSFIHERSNKHKLTKDFETTDSNSAITVGESLNDEFMKGLYKSKRKKQELSWNGLPEEYIESNDTSNDIESCESKKERRKSIVGNSFDKGSSRINKKCNKQFANLIENIYSFETTRDNLEDKLKNVHCKESEKRENSQEEIYTSLDTLTCDMSEVPVTFPVPMLHQKESVHSISEERKAYLEEQEILIHTGKWTRAEDAILTRNYLQFCLQFGVDNPYQLLGINQYRRDKQIIKFLKAKQFYVRLGKDLDNRSLRSIYMRARALFNPMRTRGRFTVEEAFDLRRAHQALGDKWTRIGEMLSRSDKNCHTAYRWHKSGINKGKWKPEEEANLIRGIEIVTGTKDISANNLQNVSWKAVVKYVPTRNEFQCRKHWAEHLAWDPSVTERKCWEKFHYAKLIHLLKYKYSFSSENEINWKELHKHFVDVAPSYIFLHKKWFSLKSKIPKDLNLNYTRCLKAFERMYADDCNVIAEKEGLINQRHNKVTE